MEREPPIGAARGPGEEVGPAEQGHRRGTDTARNAVDVREPRMSQPVDPGRSDKRTARSTLVNASRVDAGTGDAVRENRDA